MSLTVETGQGVPNADAWEDVAATKARLVAFGKTSFSNLLAADQESSIRLETSLVNAFLEPFASGRRSHIDQGMPYPRRNSYDRSGVLLGTDEIRESLKLAVAFRVEAKAGQSFDPIQSGLKRRKIDGLAEQEFFPGAGGFLSEVPESQPYILSLMETP